MNLQESQELGRHPLSQAALEQLKRLPGPYNPMTPVEQLISLMLGTERLNLELQGDLASRSMRPKEQRERLELISQHVNPEQVREAETVEEAGELIVEALQAGKAELSPAEQREQELREKLALGRSLKGDKTKEVARRIREKAEGDAQSMAAGEKGGATWS